MRGADNGDSRATSRGVASGSLADPSCDRPRLLDLFCGAGGCSVGYHRAGFDVTGVDIDPHPDYPFDFIQGDALEVDLTGYDAIHAGPPCQAHTTMSNRWRGRSEVTDAHPQLIGPIRERLIAAGVPYVIENVGGARTELLSPVLLHGGMFGLGVDRPRFFEAPWLLWAAPAGPRAVDPVGVYGKLDGRRLFTRADGTEQRAARTLEEARTAMDIDWMTWDDLREAVPPAYTEWIGEQLLTVVRSVAA